MIGDCAQKPAISDSRPGRILRRDEYLKRVLSMNINATISQMVVLFIILAAGYAANKLNIITADSNKLLSKLVVNITMPSPYSAPSSEDRSRQGWTPPIHAFHSRRFPAGVDYYHTAAPYCAASDGGLYRFMVVFGNVGFMGFPVIQSIFGSGAAFYVTLFNIPFGILCYSTGLMMLAGSGGKLKLKLLLNPMMVVSLITVLVFYTNLPVPALLRTPLNLPAG